MLIQPRSEEDHKNIIEQGFTLVELLIVIVILGILAGIVVFAVSNLTGDAAKNACATEASTVTSAAEAFKARRLTYPTDMTQLTSDQAASGTLPAVDALLKSTPKYYDDAATSDATTKTGMFGVNWSNMTIYRNADGTCPA